MNVWWTWDGKVRLFTKVNGLEANWEMRLWGYREKRKQGSVDESENISTIEVSYIQNDYNYIIFRIQLNNNGLPFGK